MWNYYFWMRVQNGADKTMATSRITNKQHERFNAIVQRIALEVQFLWKEEQNMRVGQIIKFEINYMIQLCDKFCLRVCY